MLSRRDDRVFGQLFYISHLLSKDERQTIKNFQETTGSQALTEDTSSLVCTEVTRSFGVHGGCLVHMLAIPWRSLAFHISSEYVSILIHAPSLHHLVLSTAWGGY